MVIRGDMPLPFAVMNAGRARASQPTLGHTDVSPGLTMMAKAELNLFSGVVPFVRVAEARSFREAARQLGVTTSAVSKAVLRLEAELGTRLLHRTSRTVTLTREGEEFLERCIQAVDGVQAAREAVARSSRAPRGLLSVSAPLAFGNEVLLPALPTFLARHPGLTLQVRLTDRFVHLEQEGVDAVIRIGDSPSSRLVGKKLRAIRWVTAAAPGYVARHGAPKTPEELRRHNCLKFRLPNGMLKPWEFVTHGGAPTAVPCEGNLVADHGEGLIKAAVAGVGLIQAHDYMVSSSLAEGRLVKVLADFAAPGPVVSLLTAPGRNGSPKVRAFTEFIAGLLRDG